MDLLAIPQRKRKKKPRKRSAVKIREPIHTYARLDQAWELQGTPCTFAPRKRDTIGTAASTRSSHKKEYNENNMNIRLLSILFGLAKTLVSVDANLTCKPDECLVIDAYCRVLHREPDEEGLLHYIEFLDDGNTVKEILQVLVGSDEFEELFVTDKDEEDVVGSLYDTIFGRSPDEEGAERYKTLLENGDKDYREISTDFFDSNEYDENFGTSKIPVGGRKNCGTRSGEDGDDGDDADEADGGDDGADDADDADDGDDTDAADEDDTDEVDVDDDGLDEGPVDPDLESVEDAEKLAKAVYCRVLDREADEEGLEYYTFYLLKTGNVRDMMLDMLDSEEFEEKFVVKKKDAEVVETIYEIMLAREPDEEGLKHWKGEVKEEGYMKMVNETAASDEYMENFGEFKVPGGGRKGCGN